MSGSKGKSIERRKIVPARKQPGEKEMSKENIIFRPVASNYSSSNSLLLTIANSCNAGPRAVTLKRK